MVKTSANFDNFCKTRMPFQRRFFLRERDVNFHFKIRKKILFSTLQDQSDNLSSKKANRKTLPIIKITMIIKS